MIDYITPVGGGYFFAPLGAAGEHDWVGSGLFRQWTLAGSPQRSS